MHAKKLARLILVAVPVVILGVGTTVASATKPDPTHRVTICHATASDSNPYVAITVDIASIVGDSGHGHSGVNAGDIIPAFNIDGYSYPGRNLDNGGADILANDCNLPSPTTSSTTATTFPA